MKPFLILQLRELDGAADDEFAAFLKYGNLIESEVHRIRMEQDSIADLDPLDYSGVVVGGGPSNVSDNEESKPPFQQRFEMELDKLYEKIFEYDIPYLGSCYGLGSIVRFAGGLVSKEQYSEDVGTTEIQLNKQGMLDPLLLGLPDSFTALCGHKEACQTVPEGAVVLGSSEACPVQIIRFKQHIYATQFHCELDSEGIGKRIEYYKYHGYFEPEFADELIAKTSSITVDVPPIMLQRFVEKFRVYR
ncbi:MAG: glutamine amidotransferase [Bacteroidota bacterium]